jgi:hypothetical protein
LISIYNDNVWYKEKIDRENDLLLQALTEMGSARTNSLIDSFFTTRDERRQQLALKSNFETAGIEMFYETMEGTAGILSIA